MPLYEYRLSGAMCDAICEDISDLPETLFLAKDAPPYLSHVCRFTFTSSMKEDSSLLLVDELIYAFWTGASPVPTIGEGETSSGVVY